MNDPLKQKKMPGSGVALLTCGLPLLLFLLLRYTHLQQLMASPVIQIPVIDSLYYLRWAAQLMDAGTLGAHPFFMSPLYPMFIAFSGFVTGNALTGVLYFQVAISALTLLMLVRLALRRSGSPWVGLAAGLLYALYAPALYYDGVYLSATLILFLTVTTWTLLEMEGRLPRPLITVAAGLAIGLAALARPTALLLVPAVLLLFVFQRRERVWRLGLLLLIGTLLPVLPAVIRNYQHDAGLVLTTHSAGMNFYVGNHARASGLYTEAPWLRSAEPIYESRDYIREAERRTNRGLSASEASSYWFGQGVHWMVTHPLDAAGLWLRKFAYTFNRIEAPNNVSFYGVREYSAPLRTLSPLNFGLIAALGLLGLLLHLRRRSAAVPLAIVIGYTAANVVFFVASEYRYAITGVLVVYSVLAVRGVVQRFRERQPSRGLQLMTVAVLLFFFTNIPWPVLKQVASPETDYANWASLAYQQGDLVNASLLYTAALAINPANEDNHLQLGLVYEEMGLEKQAEQEFEAAGVSRESVRALRRSGSLGGDSGVGALPDSLEQLRPDRLTALGERLNHFQRPWDALDAFERALELDSTYSRARFGRAYTQEKLGYVTVAISEYLALEKEFPNDPMLPFRLAMCYHAMERPDPANAMLQRAAKLAGQIPDKEIREQWLDRIERARIPIGNY